MTTTEPRDWLNSLSAELVSRFYDWNRTRCANLPILNSEVPEELAAFAPLDPASADGATWEEHITCETVGPPASLFDFSGEYPRWQIQFKKRTAEGSVLTPIARGGLSGSANVRAFFEGNHAIDKWMALKSTAASLPGGKFALGFHHIAYRAAKPEVPLPPDLGSGSAIAHLCDNHSCVKKSHMLLLTQQQNMDMQRCLGAVLLVKEGVIMQTLQCPHYRQNQAGVVVQPSCAKLRVIDVGENLVASPQCQQEFDDAKAIYESRLNQLFV